jgi:hypothetical protein
LDSENRNGAFAAVVGKKSSVMGASQFVSRVAAEFCSAGTFENSPAF